MQLAARERNVLDVVLLTRLPRAAGADDRHKAERALFAIPLGVLTDVLIGVLTMSSRSDIG